MVMAEIRKFIEKLGPKQMVSTRQLLAFGKRPSVDSATFRLVQNKELLRITPGLFTKYNAAGEIPPAAEIAREKALAFNRDIVPISRELAVSLGCPIDSDAEVYFATNGRTTSFLIQKTRKVQFVGVAPRKIVLGRANIGIQLRTLWLVGRGALNALVVRRLKDGWSLVETRECGSRTKQLPQWLSEWLGLPFRHLEGIAA
jgi:hypothetical protein